jgi:hypothetical protein
MPAAAVIVEDGRGKRIDKNGFLLEAGWCFCFLSAPEAGGRNQVDKGVLEQIGDLIASLRLAESQAKRLLKTAREQRIVFGLTYDYIDEDIAHLLGRLHYMQLVAERRAGDQ